MMKKKKKFTKEKLIEKDLIIIGLFLFFLVFIFYVSSSYFKSLNEFKYEGLTFNKVKYGNIPIFHHYYYIDAGQSNLIKYNLYTRTDPRTNDFIVEGEDLLIDISKPLYVSVNATGLQKCEYSVVGVSDLTSFLSDHQFNIKGGNVNFFEAWAKGQEWITCESKQDSSVIEIFEGLENKISKEGNCFKIEVANCDIMKAVDKFRVQHIIDVRKNGKFKRISS